MVFESMSEMRKHQWASHTEMFNNLKKSAKKQNKKVRGSLQHKTQRYHCKHCKHVSIGVSAMIVHAHTHKELFVNAGRKPNGASKEVAVIPTVRVLKEQTLNGGPTFNDMPVSQLLSQMIEQRNMLDQFVSYIKGVCTK